MYFCIPMQKVHLIWGPDMKNPMFKEFPSNSDKLYNSICYKSSALYKTRICLSVSQCLREDNQ